MNLLRNMKTTIERRGGKTVDIYAHIPCFLNKFSFPGNENFLNLNIIRGFIRIHHGYHCRNTLKENVTLDQNKRIASETHVPSSRDCLLCFTQNFLKCISLKREIHQVRSGFKLAMNLLRGHDIHSKVFAVCAYDCASETTIRF